MIRLAEEEDVRSILEMSKEFYPQLSYHKDSKIPLDDETVLDLARGLIESGVMLVADIGKVVGMIGLYVGPNLFNKHVKSAHEVIWWVDPKYQSMGIGVELLQAADERVKELGAVHTQLVLMPESPPQARHLYEKLGYKLTELSFTKVV